MLWASLPRMKRKQLLLLDMMRENGSEFKLLGIRVCSRAFQRLTGISAGAIQDIRERMKKGEVTIWRSDDLAWLSIKNQSKSHKYLDARSWLEAYAQTHGEQSPMNLLEFLPAGRKVFLPLAI